MSKKEYDVIIVGAGIGGLTLAKLLDKSKLNVLLLERRPTMKKLVNHIYGTPWVYVKKWKLQKYIVQKCGFGFYGPNKRTFKKLNKGPFTVVDMNPWARSMKLTCDVKTKVNIQKLRREKGGITLFDQKKERLSRKDYC